MNTKTLMTSAAVAAAMCVAALAGTAQATNLIVNGDFSTPSQGGGWSDPNIAPWVNDNGDATEVGTSTIYGLTCANTGCQNLEVNANEFDTDSQTVNGLVVGAHYTLSYLYGGRTSGGPDELNVSFGGQALTQDSGSIGVWTPNTFTITATNTSETLIFASVDTSSLGGLPSYGNEITNVSLTAVPEPATWAMMLVGFGGVGAAMRMARRNKSAAVTA